MKYCFVQPQEPADGDVVVQRHFELLQMTHKAIVTEDVELEAVFP